MNGYDDTFLFRFQVSLSIRDTRLLYLTDLLSCTLRTCCPVSAGLLLVNEACVLRGGSLGNTSPPLMHVACSGRPLRTRLKEPGWGGAGECISTVERTSLRDRSRDEPVLRSCGRYSLQFMARGKVVRAPSPAAGKLLGGDWARRGGMQQGSTQHWQGSTKA